MRAALIVGRAGSKSIVGKNLHPVLGRPLGFYPMWAALRAQLVDRVFVSTDSEELAEVGRSLGVEPIARPAELAGDGSELVDALRHAIGVIGSGVEMLITLHANCGYHRPGLVDECISALAADPTAQSCVTGYVDRAVHPFRTRRITAAGTLVPWIEVPAGTSSNRQALDPCFILDGAARAIRLVPGLPEDGWPPFDYLGRRVIPIINGRGGDVHSPEDIALTEWLLTRDGWSVGGPGDPTCGAPR